MKLSIDAAGRIVVPKRIRDSLGLSAGSELEVSTEGDSLVFRPVRGQSSLALVDGVLVHQGVPERDLVHAVDESRGARIRELILPLEVG